MSRKVNGTLKCRMKGKDLQRLLGQKTDEFDFWFAPHTDKVDVEDASINNFKTVSTKEATLEFEVLANMDDDVNPNVALKKMKVNIEGFNVKVKVEDFEVTDCR